MLKKELRLNFLHQRNLISDQRYHELSKGIADRISGLPIWDRQYFHIFLPIPGKREVDTAYLRQVLEERDKEVVVPRMAENHSLEHVLLTQTTPLTHNALGVPEPIGGRQLDPEDLDVVFLPLLAYDRNGNRVGYGKGYYDRFLAGCREDVVTVGLSFFGPVAEISDLSETDRRMDYAVTPERIYEF